MSFDQSSGKQGALLEPFFPRLSSVRLMSVPGLRSLNGRSAFDTTRGGPAIRTGPATTFGNLPTGAWIQRGTPASKPSINVASPSLAPPRRAYRSRSCHFHGRRIGRLVPSAPRVAVVKRPLPDGPEQGPQENVAVPATLRTTLLTADVRPSVQTHATRSVPR